MMSRVIRVATIVTSAAMFLGCATGPTQPDFDTARQIDVEKMRQVNAQAHRLGTEVIWVNPPQARKTGEEGAEQYQRVEATEELPTDATEAQEDEQE